MNNGLLNEIYLKAARREKIGRLAFVFILLAAFSLGVGIIFMLPSYFVLIFSKNEISRHLKTEELAVEKLQLKDTEEAIRYINDEVKFFESNELKRRSFSTVLAKVANLPSSGVELSSFELKRNSSGSFLINLRGKANTRENLLSYIEGLKNISDFSSVNSPISNILPSKELSFSLDLEINRDIYSYNDANH